MVRLLGPQLCHAIDMCYWLLDDPELQGFGQAGPSHPTLGIPMDITVGLRSPKTGTICSLAASFNNHGPIISDWRFIAVRVFNLSAPMLLRSTLKCRIA